MNKISSFLKLALVLLLLLVFAVGLGASEYASFHVRLYEGVKGAGTPLSSVVTTSFAEPYFVGDTVSEDDLQMERDKLKQVFNVNEVRLLLQTNMLYRYKPNARIFQVFNKNGSRIGLLLSKEKGKDTYRIKINEGDNYKDKDKNLLDTEAVLPEKNNVIFGFKDLKGGTYFIAFHRGVDLKEAEQSEADQVLLSTQYQPQLANYVPPVYPEKAKAVKVEGVVFVRAGIDPQGNVVAPKVTHGHPLLRQAAVEAVSKCKYKSVAPAGTVKPSTPVPFTAVVSFHLPRKGGEQKDAFGEIIGTVTRQEDGAVVPGVTVKAVNEKRNITKTTKTDQNGFYGFMGLSSGPYTLTFTHKEYMTVARKMDQQMGKTYKVNVYLKKRK